jgi:tetratricopeptide (TPR) repeat protein
MIQHLAKAVTSWSRLGACMAVVFLLLACTATTPAQTDDAFGDGSSDPVKLFERGQNAHAHGDLLKAIEFYDEAIKVRPEFAEAEFQRGSALVGLGRLPEAESGFRRTIELRKNWALPYSTLGSLLLRLKRDLEAEPLLRQALKIDARDNLALRMLADIRLRAGDAKEALDLTRRATSDPDASAATWFLRARAEHGTGDNVAALASLDHSLQLDAANLSALMERAELRIAGDNKEAALTDLKAAETLIKGDKAIAERLAADYELAGKPDEAKRVAAAAGLTPPPIAADGTLKVVGTPEEIAAANSDDALVAQKALEVLLEKNPKNGMLLARLGLAYRATDPNRSLEYYKRAATLEPANADYAGGYGAALVQARRFAEAAVILSRVIRVVPNNYAAHANLATALYELKQFDLALVEYQWLLDTKPDLTVAYYFIATAHDYLGEYDLAQTAYESFLARADANKNQLEIEKVKLRLPSLQRQIRLGQGVKQKSGTAARP